MTGPLCDCMREDDILPYKVGYALMVFARIRSLCLHAGG